MRREGEGEGDGGNSFVMSEGVGVDVGTTLKLVVI